MTHFAGDPCKRRVVRRRADPRCRLDRPRQHDAFVRRGYHELQKTRAAEPRRQSRSQRVEIQERHHRTLRGDRRTRQNDLLTGPRIEHQTDKCRLLERGSQPLRASVARRWCHRERRTRDRAVRRDDIEMSRPERADTSEGQRAPSRRVEHLGDSSVRRSRDNRRARQADRRRDVRCRDPRPEGRIGRRALSGVIQRRGALIDDIRARGHHDERHDPRDIDPQRPTPPTARY